MKKLLLLLFALSLTSCSIFQSGEEDESIEKKDDAEEVYVFDDTSESKNKSEQIDDLKKEVDHSLNTQGNSSVSKKSKEESSVFNDRNSSGQSFYLQLGAFSALKRAEQFIQENDTKVPFVMSIVYNNEKGLYTVRSTAYSTKAEAEMMRDGFKNQNMFKDSFIVTE